MSSVNWRDRFGDTGTCVRCLRTRDITDLDRLFWCEECCERARARAARGGWMAGGASAAVLALWIWLVIRPSTLILGGWIASVVAAFWLVSRIARELHYGVARYRNRRAVEAVPPADVPDGAGEEGAEPDGGAQWDDEERSSREGEGSPREEDGR